jgi:hypothetical protein
MPDCHGCLTERGDLGLILLPLTASNELIGLYGKGEGVDRKKREGNQQETVPDEKSGLWARAKRVWTNSEHGSNSDTQEGQIEWATS